MNGLMQCSKHTGKPRFLRTNAAIGSEQSKGSMMRRREFIAGIGGAVALPAVARAQQPALPVIGLLNWGEERFTAPGFSAFRQGLAERGYTEGINVNILYQSAEFQRDRLTDMAADLVRRRVAVIVTTSGLASALAAKAATTTIPIVFQLGADPVEFGLVSSLGRPGGNITGATFLTQTLIAKRFELLHEAVPAAKSIGYLVNPESAQTPVMLKESQNAAHALGFRVLVLNATVPRDIEAAFAAVKDQHIDALCVDTDPFFTTHGVEIAALAARHAVPAIYGFSAIVKAGGLMSYGSDASDAYRLAGQYAGMILGGAKPGDLPVQQSTKIELVINLKAAKELGITFPLTLHGRADEVIE
jgi:putative tryptophan/tyrosine transport system substrate-binding protein